MSKQNHLFPQRPRYLWRIVSLLAQKPQKGQHCMTLMCKHCVWISVSRCSWHRPISRQRDLLHCQRTVSSPASFNSKTVPVYKAPKDTAQRVGTQTDPEGTVGMMSSQSCGPNSHGDLRPVSRKGSELTLNYRCFRRLKRHADNLCRVQRPVLGAEN